MKINKKALLKALRITSHATKSGEREKAFPFERYILLSGPGQRVVANNLVLGISVPLEISGNDVEGSLPDLSDMKIADMKEFAKAPENNIEIPKSVKKADHIREYILKACEKKQAAQSSLESICLPGNDLAKILSTLERETVELTESEDGTVSIGEKYHSLVTMPPNEYPMLNEGPDIGDLVSTVSVPIEHLAAVALASSPDEKPGGILFDPEEGYVVASDGMRLHRTPLTEVDMAEGVKSFYMTVAMCACLKTLYNKKNDSTVKLSHWSETIKAENKNGASVVANCPPGLPYDWKQLMEEGDKGVVIVKKDFAVPLSQALAIADSSYYAMNLKFNGGLEMTIDHPNKGGYQNINVPVEWHTGEKPDETVEVRLNAHYFTDVLSIAKKPEDKISLGFIDEKKPIFFKHEDIDGLILPMRFNA